MKLINALISTIKNLDKKIYKVMINGFKFSFVLCLIATYILLSYKLYGMPFMFYIGISVFKAALTFGVTFFICGICFNTVIKEIG